MLSEINLLVNLTLWSWICSFQENKTIWLPLLTIHQTVIQIIWELSLRFCGGCFKQLILLLKLTVAKTRQLNFCFNLFLSNPSYYAYQKMADLLATVFPSPQSHSSSSSLDITSNISFNLSFYIQSPSSPVEAKWPFISCLFCNSPWSASFTTSHPFQIHYSHKAKVIFVKANLLFLLCA